MTDKQPKLAELAKEVPAREAWRVFGIMAELVEATERLVGIHPAVSVFGSARVKPGTPYYELAEKTAKLLSEAGFAVVCGGGPGLMEAANAGALSEDAMNAVTASRGEIRVVSDGEILDALRADAAPRNLRAPIGESAGLPAQPQDAVWDAATRIDSLGWTVPGAPEGSSTNEPLNRAG